MSTQEKVKLAQRAKEEGYKLSDIFPVLELPKSTWYYWQEEKIDYREKYAEFKPLIDDIIGEHPEYGYRRIKKGLLRKYGRKINHKTLQRLLKEWDFEIKRNIKKPPESSIRRTIRECGNRADLVSNRKDIDPFEAVITDFTKVRYASGEKIAKLMPVIGYSSKMIYGWALDKRRSTDVALRAWERAKESINRFNIPLKGMIIHHDKDSVYTGHRWLRQLLFKDRVKVSYAERGAKDNVVMESFNSRFKGENSSLFLSTDTLEELREVIEDRVQYYNTDRLHSTLDYKTPIEYIREARRTDES